MPASGRFSYCQAYSCSNPTRMILYYPVSALVTLFANILQNPQDARVRTDVRLMNQVVNFLSLLSSDEETGGVRRMLGVCSEFERIAKVVLEKSDKESHTRRKRKSPKDADETTQLTPEKRTAQQTPEMRTATTPVTMFSPNFGGDLLTQSFTPTMNNYPSPNSTGEGSMLPDFMPGPGDFPNMMTEFSDMQQFGNASMGSPLNVGSFQQPFVPQDLWQMPMTLEWDWADMQGMNYSAGGDEAGQPQFTNGTSLQTQQGSPGGLPGPPLV